MPIEDEDSKVRRNLVAASVIVLLAWWFDVPVPAVMNKFFGIQASAEVPITWRVWLAALVALAYVILRFRFSNEARETWPLFTKHLRDQIERTIGHLLRFEVALYNRFKVASPIFVDALSNLENQAQSRRQRIDPGDHETYVMSVEDHELNGGHWFNGNWRVAHRWTGPMNVSHSSDTSYRFNVRGWRRCAIVFWATAHSLFYSREALLAVWPMVLAALAAVICGVKLCITW